VTRAAAIRIIEVGPRDGLQNEAAILSPKARIGMIEALASAGLKSIEAGSFVSPAKVPQMADTDKVLAKLASRSDLRLPVLVPNAKGLAAAKAAGARDIAIFAAASETFSRRNINRGIDESLAEYRAVAADALSAGIGVRGYVSCVLGCPYEGKIAIASVVRVAAALTAMGCDQVSLGDTIGVGTADQALAMTQTVASEIGISRVALHFHDTYGQALANVLACLDLGVTALDASVAGLGGCPYAPGASGNLATEDLVYMLEGLGIATGVDLEKLAAAGAMACAALGTRTRSRTALALAARRNAKEVPCTKAV
jgi:hydroxymethylglutaryl-CoA lyase